MSGVMRQLVTLAAPIRGLIKPANPRRPSVDLRGLVVPPREPRPFTRQLQDRSKYLPNGQRRGGL